MLTASARRAEAGVSLIEVLIAMVIIAFGLLGLAALQSKAQLTELEAYQRSQAIVLLEDMAQRMRINQPAVDTYVTASPLGTGDFQPADCIGQPVGVALDQCEWSNALKGAAETKGGTRVGAMVDARGCVERIRVANPALGVCDPGVYRVSVSWQGLHPTVSPVLNCARGSYGDDRLRRIVSQQVVLGLPQCS